MFAFHGVQMLFGVLTANQPAVNRGELALLYAVVFLYIACRGCGAWSLDRRFARRPVENR